MGTEVLHQIPLNIRIGAPEERPISSLIRDVLGAILGVDLREVKPHLFLSEGLETRQLQTLE